MKPIRLILHPSDFSPASRPAYARAVDMAKSGNAELLVHVLAPASDRPGALGRSSSTPSSRARGRLAPAPEAFFLMARLTSRSSGPHVRSEPTSSSWVLTAAVGWPSSSSGAWRGASLRPRRAPC